ALMITSSCWLSNLRRLALSSRGRGFWPTTGKVRRRPATAQLPCQKVCSRSRRTPSGFSDGLLATERFIAAIVGVRRGFHLVQPRLVSQFRRLRGPWTPPITHGDSTGEPVHVRTHRRLLRRHRVLDPRSRGGATRTRGCADARVARR